MKKEHAYILGGIALLLLFMGQKWLDLAASVVATFEKFRASPYWDVTRYSWGYGTAAPRPTGTIDRAKALADMKKVLERDYSHLKPQITRALGNNQWAALLSFSYNIGQGGADKLIADINSRDEAALEGHWKQYVYSEGRVNPNLVDRRQKEWQLWSRNIL